MRTLSVFFLTVFSTFFLLLNCAQSSKKTRPPVTSIIIAPRNTKYFIGTKLSVTFKTKIKDGSLSKTEVFLDGKFILKNDKPEFNLEISTLNQYVGIHYIKVVATTTDGTQGENYTDFLLLSDLSPQKLSYKIIKSYPHNIEHFTEGLEIRNGFLYEGTGQEGSSAIYKTDLSNWKVIKEYKLENQYFGEGITILNGKLYQLTYKSQIGFVRNLDSFELIKSWNFKNEQGWGLTNDSKYLIMSDGTEFLYYIDPETFKEIKKIQVCNNEGTVKNINELEFINDEIWANIWTTDTIVIIDPKTGKIKAEINLKGLLSTNPFNSKNPVDVLNGIAYDHQKNKIYVTGKLWPKIFEIELVKTKN